MAPRPTFLSNVPLPTTPFLNAHTRILTNKERRLINNLDVADHEAYMQFSKAAVMLYAPGKGDPDFRGTKSIERENQCHRLVEAWEGLGEERKGEWRDLVGVGEENVENGKGGSEEKGSRPDEEDLPDYDSDEMNKPTAGLIPGSPNPEDVDKPLDDEIGGLVEDQDDTDGTASWEDMGPRVDITQGDISRIGTDLGEGWQFYHIINRRGPGLSVTGGHKRQTTLLLWKHTTENIEQNHEIVVKAIEWEDMKHPEVVREQIETNQRLSSTRCDNILTMRASNLYEKVLRSDPNKPPRNVAYLYLDYAEFGSLENLRRRHYEIPIPEPFLWVVFRALAEAVRTMRTGKCSTKPQKVEYVQEGDSGEEEIEELKHCSVCKEEKLRGDFVGKKGHEFTLCNICRLENGMGDDESLIDKNPQIIPWKRKKEKTRKRKRKAHGEKDGESGERNWHPMVHMDIKPENILLERPKAPYRCYPNVVLADFGVTYVEGKHKENEHRGFGTFTWKAPEQEELEGRYATFQPPPGAGAPLNDKTDIFCIGLVMYTLMHSISKKQLRIRNFLGPQRQDIRCSKLPGNLDMPISGVEWTQELWDLVDSCLKGPQAQRPGYVQLQKRIDKGLAMMEKLNGKFKGKAEAELYPGWLPILEGEEFLLHQSPELTKRRKHPKSNKKARQGVGQRTGSLHKSGRCPSRTVTPPDPGMAPHEGGVEGVDDGANFSSPVVGSIIPDSDRHKGVGSGASNIAGPKPGSLKNKRRRKAGTDKVWRDRD